MQLWSPFLLALGVIIYFSLENEPSFALIFSIGALTAMQCLLLFWVNIASSTRNGRSCKSCVLGFQSTLSVSILSWFDRNNLIKSAVITSLLICAGFLAAKIRTEIVSTKFMKKCLRNTTGTVIDVSNHDKYIKLLIEYDDSYRVKIISRIKNNDRLEVGDRIIFSACVKPPPNKVTPFGYDEAMFAYFDKITATGFATSQIKVIEGKKPVGIFSQIREKIYKNFQENMPNPYSEIASALVVGKKDGIPSDIKQSFRDSGTAHLLAISGLHLSLVGFIMFNSIRFLLALSETIAIKFDIKKIASIFGVIFSYFYLQIAGSPVSAERAFIMISVFFLSVLIDRRSNVLRSIAFAAIVIIIFSPENVLKPGFQMSFLAVLGICSGLVDFPIYRRESSIKKLLYFFVGIVISSCLAIFATFPFAIYHFNSFSINGVFANLIAIPIVTFITMPLIILTLVLMPIAKISLLYKLIALSLELLVRFNNHIAYFDQLKIHSFSGMTLIILTFGMLILFLTKTYVRYLGFLPIAVGLLNAHSYEPPDAFISREHVMLKGENNQYYVLGDRLKNSMINRWLEHASAQSLHGKNSMVKKVNNSIYIYERQNKRIALIYGREMLDCNKYDLIFDFTGSSKCKNAFTNINALNQGVIFLWVSEGKLEASTKNRKW